MRLWKNILNLNSPCLSLNFTDTIFNNSVTYGNVISSANFKGCTFNNVLKPAGTTVLTNCTFTTEGLCVAELAEGNSIKLINCKYEDQTIDELTITMTNDAIVLSNTALFETVEASNGTIRVRKAATT